MSWLARLRTQLWGTDRRRLATVLFAVLLVRVPFVFAPVMTDEAGFFQVAKSWGSGPYLYGHYWVDRPPGLIGLFRVAALLGDVRVVRVLALLFALAFVVLVHRITRRSGGSAAWATVVAGCFVVTPATQAPWATGELFAIPLVTAAIGATIEAVRARGWTTYAWGVTAGAAAMAAVSIKQDFVDGFAFAAVFVLALVVRRELGWRRAGGIVLAGVLGLVAVTGAMILVGLTSRAGVSGLWFSVVQFRAQAAGVIATHSTAAPMKRADVLLLVAIGTGLVPILVVLVARVLRAHFRGSAFAWAIGAALVVELVGVMGGGSYWKHYLIGLAPTVALAVGRWSPTSRALRWMAVVVVASAVNSAAAVGAYASTHDMDGSGDIGGWVAASGTPGDTATVLFGHAEAQLATGMRSPYPYLWTLPMRTLDPRLARLTHLLDGPAAPTWVLQWSTLNPWKIDANGQLQQALDRNYTLAAVVCGHDVWLHRGELRTFAALPSCTTGTFSAAG